jgi:benzoylformate decarboxylase
MSGAEVNRITGRSAFLSVLKDEGVSHLFGNPGTTELPIMHALKDHPDLTYVLGLQESIVVAMAEGFSRASGKLSACNVHVAPGLGNAMGALYNAKFTGTPMILTAGQQEQGHGLTEPLLYDPLVPIAQPLVKWAAEINRLDDLPRIVRRAAKIALTPPTGPVFISLPGDILNDEGAIELGGRTRVEAAGRPSDETLARLADRLLAAKKPVIVAGHEVQSGDALAEAARFAEVLGAPVYQQTVPWGAHFLSEHPAFMGALTREQAEVRDALSDYDLLVCLGADVLRMSVWSEVDPLPEGMAIVQISQRDWELGKNYATELAIRSDLKETLKALNPLLETKGGAARAEAAAAALEALADRNWTAQRAALREKTLAAADREPVDPALLMLRAVEALPEDAVVVDEGITTSRALLKFLPFRDSNCFYGLSSGGIGWGIAAAVGIQLAHPDRPLLAVIGDGSAMYSIQALWTAAHLKLPITYVIGNNASYRILKQRLLAFHGNDQFVGMDFSDPPIDFTGLAQSLGMTARRITDPAEIGPAVEAAMASGGPNLLDVAVEAGVG